MKLAIAIRKIALPVFVFSLVMAVVLGLIVIWGGMLDPELLKVWSSFVLIAVASAFALGGARAYLGSSASEPDDTTGDDA